jgi:hypothetical protein
MDWTSLIGPAEVAAGIAGIVSVITLVMNRATTLTTHSQRLAFEREQSERKSSADIALAQQKLGLDREFAAWKRRTIPRGFESCSHRHGTLLYSVSSVFASIPEFLGSGSEDQDHIREGTEGSQGRRRNADSVRGRSARTVSTYL